MYVMNPDFIGARFLYFTLTIIEFLNKGLIIGNDCVKERFIIIETKRRHPLNLKKSNNVDDI